LSCDDIGYATAGQRCPNACSILLAGKKALTLSATRLSLLILSARPAPIGSHDKIERLASLGTKTMCQRLVNKPQQRRHIQSRTDLIARYDL
jgi:hypothetical protein